MVKDETIRTPPSYPAPGSMVPDPVLAGTHPARAPGGDRTAWLLAAFTGALSVIWALLSLRIEQTGIVILAAEAQVGVEAAAALSCWFGALVLSLFPADQLGIRLRWVASGFVILGLGSFAFGYLPPLLGVVSDLNTSTYASLIVRTIAGGLFVIGLAPHRPADFSRRWLLISIGLLGLLSVVIIANVNLLPRLLGTTDPQQASAFEQVTLRGLTTWHWVFATVPLGLAAVAVLGAAYHSDGGSLARWLVVAMTLLAGSQFYNALWPSAYSPVLTIADVLRVAFAGVLSVGGIIELRRVAAERTALLAAEQEHSRRLVELAVLKADFTAMVAHELSNPLAAIRGYAEMMATRSLSPEDQDAALATIRSESNTLITLINDIRIAATVERDDFAVRVSAVPVGVLLADAAAFGRTLPGDHPIPITIETHAMVIADQERIGQVLRNLLINASNFSADGTPIEIRATNQGTRVRISVVDHGIGITPRDMVRIFEKFGRGHDQAGKKVPGAGLGLYLSRRIVQAHGADLAVESTPGVGSVFSFEVEAAR